MLTKPDARPVFAHVARRFADFRSDEGGAIAIFIVIIFVMILMLGGIAVDIMRFEMRRVALQETLDRATLAAANVVLPPDQTPQSVVTEWFNKAGLGNELTVDYSPPTAGGEATKSSREAWARAKVRSYNHFMPMLDMPYFEGPAVSVAQQGVSKIEVIMVLDITGSMSETSGSTSKIEALRKAADKFVTVLKFSKNDTDGEYTVSKDPNNLISIGLVPYSSNVNIPVSLRNKFTKVTNLSSWDGMANQGVPDINCFEIPESTYDTLALPTTTTLPMQAVAQTASSKPSVTVTNFGTNNTYGGVVKISAVAATEPSKNTNSYTCNHGDNFGTAKNEKASNLLALPSTSITALKAQIGDLNPRGTTSIAIGMRWATAMIDQSARQIYTDLLTAEPAMAGRPADNADPDTRKIIVLMTDGTHVASDYILDAYKTGPSPIWRGNDGNMAIEFDDSGVGINGGKRPGIAPTGNPVNTCSGWSLANTVVNGKTVKRNFFVPHLKSTKVKRKKNNEAEGKGTDTEVEGGCDPLAWISATGTPAAPKWSGSGTVRQLDWSEVWRYASVDWVIEQLYMRSNVAGATDYNTIYKTFVGDYLVGESHMDALLSANCTAAKAAGVEVFGIILGDKVTEGPIKNCSSPGTGYYYKVTNADNLTSAFEQIAVLISDLKLTQ
ncbi:Tad domain-containing protein [Tabrizicola sp.]|uniref:Tad domain-containing protein n=1 Tax=Tabrizicola sp. TaxID=2005166 RepID=UPI002FDD8EA6